MVDIIFRKIVCVCVCTRPFALLDDVVYLKCTSVLFVIRGGCEEIERCAHRTPSNFDRLFWKENRVCHYRSRGNKYVRQLLSLFFVLFCFFLLVVVAIFLDKTCKLYRYRVLIASARLVWLDSFKLAALFPLPFPPFTKRADVEIQIVSLFSEEMTSTRLTTDHISNRSILFWTWLKFQQFNLAQLFEWVSGGWAVAHCRILFVGGLILSMDE